VTNLLHTIEKQGKAEIGRGFLNMKKNFRSW
jgi:hypothetical protein